MTTKTSLTTNSMNRSPLRAFHLISFVLVCFPLTPQARATCQDGCLTNNNTVLGDDALISLTTGTGNTAIGYNALNHNHAGSSNTAIGNTALYSNTTGGANTATGDTALYSNTTGSSNTAIGQVALFYNTTGNNNTAAGKWALYYNTTGSENTAIGRGALWGNTGSSNIALGDAAGFSLTTGRNNIDIGNKGVRAESNTIRIGKVETHTATFIAGISGATVPTGVAVIIDTDGHLGTITSSARFKEAIKPMDRASEAILALKPVTFRYKHELDPEGIPQFGLVAEEVEKVNPALVARDDDGKPYTVRYEAVNAMLLNEFLKEHGKVEEQQGKISDLRAALAQQGRDLGSAIARQQEEIRALSASLQKLSNQLELMNAGTRVVVNEQ